MPRTCPPPQPDCPLYDRRLELQSEGEALRRAILHDSRQAGPSLRDLIRADLARTNRRPAALLPPAEPAQPLPLPVDHQSKGVHRE